MAPDPLAPDALLALARRLVAPDASLSTPAQALALVVHALHSALGFRLVQPAPTEGADPPNRLPDDWPHPQGELKFRYKHDQSSLEFVISVVNLGDRLLVAGAAVDNPQRSSTFDLLQSDYFSPTSLSPSSPLRASSLSPSTPFATPTRLADLIHLYRLNILQRLVPGLSKDGYSELPAASSSSTAGGGNARAPPLGGGTGAGAGPYLPDRGGPMGMFPPSGPSGSGSGGRSPSSGGGGGSAHPRPHAPEHDPLAVPGTGGRGGLPLADIGRRDLDPLGGMTGTFGGLPGGGFGGGGLGGMMGGGAGGMFMGPDHPLFRERFGPGSDTVGGGGAVGRRWGGDGYLPPIGAPQGARFDPVGPVNGPPTGGLGGPNAGGGPLRPGQQPPQGPPGGLGGFGGAGRRAHPDMEQPGTNSDWHNSMFG
ncbi:hypothetical protein JCM10449v2_007617 [Rhodotorula kratochvilovae]